MADSNYRGTLGKVSAVSSVVALIVHIIGFSTRYWQKAGVFHQGLWGWCLGDLCSEGRFTKSIGDLGDFDWSWLEATQAFETLGFIAGLAALVLIVLYIFVPSTAGKKIVFILAMVACFAAAGCIILGIIIYGSEMDNLSWSFALCTIAGVIFGVAGVLLLLDFCKR